MIFLRRIILKLHDIGCARQMEHCKAKVEKDVPGYARYMEHLTRGTAIGVKGHPWRALDQLRVLRKVKPLRIVEIGSGTSTGIFADYIHKQSGGSLLSLDESAKWAELTLAGLVKAGLAPIRGIELKIVTRLENDRGSFLDISLPSEIDLLYIDGPSVMTRNGVETANQDIIRHLNAGHRPGAIMVDGRTETVDAIREHSASSEYDFVPSISYIGKARNVRLGDYLTFDIYHRHSFFLRRGH